MIHFRDINLSFDNKTVFEHFSLDVREGDKVLLRAPSGKGKSTLFKLMLGFQRVDSGEIRLKDKVLNRDNLSWFRKNICYVSQDVDFANENVWTLIEGIFSYRSNRNIEMTKEKVMDIAGYLELPGDLLETDVRQLSGGERQRLGLLVCILLDRPIWLLDEITAGLDARMKEQVVAYVLKQEKTILIISHDRVWTRNDCVRIEEW